MLIKYQIDIPILQKIAIKREIILNILMVLFQIKFVHLYEF